MQSEQLTETSTKKPISRFQPGKSGNPGGRPKIKDSIPDGSLGNREIRNKNLLELARKLKPLQARAIATAAQMLDSNLATGSEKLKAAALIMQTYKNLISEIYDQSNDKDETKQVPEEVQKSPEVKPVFSLHVLPKKEEEVKE